MEWANPPQLPSLNLPEAFQLPIPILEVPQADIPSYKPLVVPPNTLSPPPGIEGINSDPAPEEGAETTKSTTPTSPTFTPKIIPPEAQILQVPFTDIEVPMPTTTIMTTAATTAFISVGATLAATSLFKYIVMLMKPIFKQAWSKLQKKKIPTDNLKIS